jgi:hypothetical protein
MNKYLMMSAAAVMGTIGSGAASAGTFVTTVGFWNVNQTLNYCDHMNVYNDANGQVSAQHVQTTCDTTYFTYYHNVGDLGAAAKKMVVLGDPQDGPSFQLTYNLGEPFNKAKKGVLKTKWAIYYAFTSGSTAYFLNSGYEGPAYPKSPKGMKGTHSAAKLASIMKNVRN